MAIPPVPASEMPLERVEGPTVGGQSISLQTALFGTLNSNPDLVALRQGNPSQASPEAVEVARRFPTTLNPTLWIDFRPITLIPQGTFGTGSSAGGGGAAPHQSFYKNGNAFLYMSLRQPLELGHQTTHRYNIAKAALKQQQWTVVQAELLALVQTYRFFQTAAYRREKLRIARQLADFNDHLLQGLRRRLEAGDVQAADVSLASVESRAARQQVKAAEQDYITALTDLRNQIGVPETAGAAEPLGEFTLPSYIPQVSEESMIQTAVQSRPEIMAARALVEGTGAATNLARADRIPSPIVGPEYQIDEAGIQYIGFVYITPLPYVNNGTPLVRQREAENRRACIALRQVQQRVIAQVRAAVAKWNGAASLVNESNGLTAELAKEVNNMERLFDAGQTDLTRLMQGRQRLIQLENAELDAVWQATQAQADLLTALGSPALINGMVNRAETADAPSSSRTSPPTPNVAAPPAPVAPPAR